ncbi:hypothetical protein ABT56_11625 [Photobacterium aquae]|uniref:Uncharacterized protein n=1 Tax=Photobacterium aquae TaxID=1195763 RepID=A0A0J1H0M3_9GAMM|nr:hypothetical protein [Photobacterium aquae]KLV05366.1 hypothetical protein ABT56_11625 [Photobacterium aquae]
MYKFHRYKQQLEKMIIILPSVFLSIEVISQIPKPVSTHNEILFLLTLFALPIGFNVIFKKLVELLNWLINNGKIDG